MPHRSLLPKQRENVFHTIMEALTNVLRHAQAKTAWLRIHYDAPILAVAVEDDGIGMPAGETRRFGNGLRNMRWRIAELGGTIEWRQRPEGGTIVRLAVPVGQA
jgi:signal transduction histidine kinase